MTHELLCFLNSTLFLGNILEEAFAFLSLIDTDGTDSWVKHLRLPHSTLMTTRVALKAYM